MEGVLDRLATTGDSRPALRCDASYNPWREEVLSQAYEGSGREAEYAADMALLDELEITLDSDPRFRTNAGLGVAGTSIPFPGQPGAEESDDDEDQARAFVEDVLEDLLAARGLGNGAHG